MKDIVLKRLKQANGEYVSGEELGNILNVSRTSVWKYIKDLKEDGYNIESSSRKGYRLLEKNDILNAFEIKSYLNTGYIGKKVFYFKEISSTNIEAKRLAAEDCEDGTVVVAERQTQGRGRLGRAWDSMNEKGAWMSIVLRPKMLPQDVQIITLAASVAVVKAIKRITGINTGIKWPNDIILNGKKVCGILTEMSSEIDCINYIVIGIGLNVNQSEGDFDNEIRDKATSLKIYNKEISNLAKDFSRSNLIKGILEEFEQIYEMTKKGDTKSIITEWKKHSITINSYVRITSFDGYVEGKALDINQEGKLIIQCKDGKTREISSGEISIRGIMGYV